MDLSRSNGQKRHSLILIFLLGSYLLFRIYDIPYLSLKSKTGIHSLRSLFLLHCPYGCRPWIFGNVVPAYGVMNEQNPTFLLWLANSLPVWHNHGMFSNCRQVETFSVLWFLEIQWWSQISISFSWLLY